MPDDLAFLDTSGWISLLDARDAVNAAASRAWLDLRRRGRTIVCTEWVVAETGNGLARGPGRATFVEGLRLLQTSPRCRLILIDGDLMDRAVLLVESRQDKAWGLVDCASFVVMMDLGIRDAFTRDHHFEQAGFRRLLPMA